MSAKVRGAGRAHPKSYSPKRTFIAYLACYVCGHWWPCQEFLLRNLMDVCRFTCPFCAEGHKKVAQEWDGKTRAMPVPPMLDVRLPVEEKP